MSTKKAFHAGSVVYTYYLSNLVAGGLRADKLDTGSGALLVLEDLIRCVKFKLDGEALMKSWKLRGTQNRRALGRG